MSKYRKEANEVLKETKWTLFKVLPILIVVLAVIFAISSVIKVGSKVVERQVLVNSHQYIEGMEQRANILKANIVEIDVMISTGQGNKDQLLGQKRILKSQLLAITQ